ncbi:MAG: hypothetical protein QNJ70_01460 [Xenococcaceae cyanobacterium MO_207.B15]|nr:hypothetical protein [Xenococcaceae cyanobacterium MO_207.B15]
MVKIFQEVKRLGTKLMGKGPYDLAPFSYFCDRDRDESQFGMDRPESFTGILHEEATGWVEFCTPTTFMTKVVNPRFIGSLPRYIPFGIAPEPSRIIFSLSRGGIIGNTGMIYDITSRLAVAETTHNWTINCQYFLNLNNKKLICTNG